MSRLVVFAASDMEGRAVGKTAGPNELALVIAGMGPETLKRKLKRFWAQAQNLMRSW